MPKLNDRLARWRTDPVAFIREALGDLDAGRQPIRASEDLDIRQSDYPGGIQIWASNPAILWTAPRPEQEGIHVHLFSDRHGPPVVDETFDLVRVDGRPTMPPYVVRWR